MKKVGIKLTVSDVITIQKVVDEKHRRTLGFFHLFLIPPIPDFFFIEALKVEKSTWSTGVKDPPDLRTIVRKTLYMPSRELSVWCCI